MTLEELYDLCGKVEKEAARLFAITGDTPLYRQQCRIIEVLSDLYTEIYHQPE